MSVITGYTLHMSGCRGGGGSGGVGHRNDIIIIINFILYALIFSPVQGQLYLYLYLFLIPTDSK
jgi:hypothetical protein